MELIPYSRERAFRPLQRQVNRLIEDFFGDSDFPISFGRVDEWAPAMDIAENKDEFVVTAELPGIKAENVDISVTGNSLTLKGEKKQEKEESGENFHRVERSYGSFTRSVTLPSTVDSTKVNATMKNGVLKIHIGKKEESKPKSIHVKSE